jgi:hypothetical protein
MPFVEEHDLVVGERAAEADRLSVKRAMRAICSHVCPTVAEPSMPSTARSVSWAAKPAIIPAWVDPVTEHVTTVSKTTSSSRSCSATSSAQRAKPSPPSGWSDAPAGMAYGFPSAASTEASASSQLLRIPMSKPAGSSRTSAPMIRESRMLPTLS